MDKAMALYVATMAKYENINETIEKGDSDIQKTYQDAVIFITGGSGFMGKQLVEKLLRSCAVKKIYLLMRSKKSDTIDERLAKILESSVYDELRKKQPNFAEKITPVDGDVVNDRLGLSDESWNTLTEEVNFIFHGAATISFAEPLRTATRINVKGTIEALNLGKACKNLKSYVHLSTAYSHATVSKMNGDILEKFYDSPLAPTTLIDLVEKLDEKNLDLITPQLTEGRYNTYLYTKAVAEEAVRTMAGDMPICIVRPCFVGCTYREPMPGWIDKSCLMGPTGVIFGFILGALHVLYTNIHNNIGDMPLDLANNAIIAAGWRTAVVRSDTVKIYNMSGMRKAFTMSHMHNILSNYCTKDLVTDRSLWYCCGIGTNSKFMFTLMTWVFHYIPAYLVDVILFLSGNKMRVMPLYKKFYRMSNVISPFIRYSWYFRDTNLLELFKNMSPADQVIYDCDIASVDRSQQLIIWMLGVRKYIIKDGLENTAWGVKKQFYFKIAHYVVVPLYFYVLWRIGFAIISVLIYTFYTGYCLIKC